MKPRIIETNYKCSCNGIFVAWEISNSYCENKQLMLKCNKCHKKLPTDYRKLEDVIQMIGKNYRDCDYTLNEGKMNKRPESWIENFKGRMDELVILYSELLDITNDKAKQLLEGE